MLPNSWVIYWVILCMTALTEFKLLWLISFFFVWITFYALNQYISGDVTSLLENKTSLFEGIYPQNPIIPAFKPIITRLYSSNRLQMCSQSSLNAQKWNKSHRKGQCKAAWWKVLLSSPASTWLLQQPCESHCHVKTAHSAVNNEPSYKG